VHARRAALAAADMQTAGGKLDLVPLEVAKLGRSQAVPVANQDHRGVPVPVPAHLAGGRHQSLDLGAGEIIPGAGD